MKKILIVLATLFIGMEVNALEINNVNFTDEEIRVIHKIGFTNDDLMEMTEKDLLILKNIDPDSVKIKKNNSTPLKDSNAKAEQYTSVDGYDSFNSPDYLVLAKYKSGNDYYARAKIIRNSSKDTYKWHYIGITTSSFNIDPASGNIYVSAKYNTNTTTNINFPSGNLEEIVGTQLEPYNLYAHNGTLYAFYYPNNGTSFNVTYRRKFTSMPSAVCMGHYYQTSQTGVTNISPNSQQIYVLQNGWYLWNSVAFTSTNFYYYHLCLSD